MNIPKVLIRDRSESSGGCGVIFNNKNQNNHYYCTGCTSKSRNEVNCHRVSMKVERGGAVTVCL